MNNKWIVLIAIIAVGGFIAGCGRDHRSSKNDRLIKIVSKRLQLDDQQKAKLVLLHKELENLRYETNRDHSQLKEEFVSLLEADSLDQQQVLNIIERKQSQVDELAPQVVGVVSDFHSSLSQEQRKKLVEEIKKHSHGQRYKRHHFRGRFNS